MKYVIADILVVIFAIIGVGGCLGIVWIGIVTVFRPFFPKFFDRFEESDLSDGPIYPPF